MKSHIQHLEAIFKVLQEQYLLAKMYKCSFGQEKVEYLGYVILGERVATDPSKIEAMHGKFPLKELRSFLGLTDYYKKFIKSYGVICKPLTDVLKKDSFKWSHLAQKACASPKKKQRENIVP